MGFVWFLLARKLQISTKDPAGALFGAAAVVASLFGVGVIVVAETVPGVPGIVLLATASVIFLSLMLAVDWFTQWPWRSTLTGPNRCAPTNRRRLQPGD